ncbi:MULTISPECIES: hypothetical protein [unclassified Leptolyngbya]|uniref:hypothetical protein n=1 Tax=unclassified Leptolyngbya TaxID=2650499 RepID=UPI0016824C91|nr:MULTISPECIES: hypothetical protein [unclassified Leptolyngbya]MBD1909119.1 hypothetical protein [Leptolyngbya sp. FACHB-8]MBD2157492.1 hypothetical protein [Leptolyngbya sp. FACHB-16]
MPDENRSQDENQAYPEGKFDGDPNIGEAGLDKVLLRVEGQNENITAPPPDVEEGIAETARAIGDTIMGIEDAS